jgi:ADP-heptose:LPS heptosyltransferase
MQGLLKSAVPVWKAKAGQKLGYHWQREGASLFVPPVHPQNQSYHIVDQLLDVIRGAGIEVNAPGYGLEANEADVTNIMVRLDELGLSGRFVAINAGSAWPSKRWAPAHFACVIDRLHENGIQSLMIGTSAPADRDAADQVNAACKYHPIDMLGQTSVVELIALLSMAAAHLAGDTGSLHIANALGIPLVALYSITKPHRTGPYGRLDFCHYDPIHLNNIGPEKVLNSLLSVL